MQQNNRSMVIALVNIVVCVSFLAVYGQGAVPPTDGMELWITADSVQVQGTQVAKIFDLSGKNNSPTHYTESGMDLASPALIKSAYNGHATLRFNNKYTGFGMTNIPNIRCVFAALMKDSTSCTPRQPCCAIPPKFWLGQLDGVTNFHPDHGCTILRDDLNEASPLLCYNVHTDAPTYVNKGPAVDARFIDFPFKLGVINLNSSGNVKASTIGRDRTMTDRSFQGDISEIIIYNKPIDSATRIKIRDYLGSKYGIAGFPATPAMPQSVSNARTNAFMISITHRTTQTMGLKIAGTGAYSIKIHDLKGRVVNRKTGIAPDALVVRKADFPNGSYYLTGNVKNAPVHQNMAILW